LVRNDPLLAEADAQVTPRFLAALIKNSERWTSLFAVKAPAMNISSKTGGRLAALLGCPSISCVSKIEVTGGA
jgi:electron transfer flavoprotein alpha/beta subunit